MLKLGSFEVPAFNDVMAVFGADIRQYPKPTEIPEVDGRYEDIVSALFFNGGKLSDHNLRFKDGIDKAAAMTAIHAWLSSFAPKHEHKMATVAWALSEWCEKHEVQA